ncbi:hypothetical protein D3C81_1477520 [compost metagenome]
MTIGFGGDPVAHREDGVQRLQFVQQARQDLRRLFQDTVVHDDAVAVHGANAHQLRGGGRDVELGGCAGDGLLQPDKA